MQQMQDPKWSQEEKPVSPEINIQATHYVYYALYSINKGEKTAIQWVIVCLYLN